MVSSKSQAMQKLLLVVGILFFLLVSLHVHAQTVHHELSVELMPGLKMLKAENTLRFSKDTPRKISFLLHKDLTVSVLSTDDSLALIHAASAKEMFSEYGLTLGTSDDSVTLAYHGVIFDPIQNQESRGLISAEGAALFGGTYWYPVFLGTSLSFEATVKTPAPWRSLMQGQLTKHETHPEYTITRFNEIYPQESMYLVAGDFKVHSTTGADGRLYQVFLRKDDPALAQSYLKLIPEYVEHYSQILGRYPYSAFTVVENMWETGYGMPSFTLLGPSVIRLPFILTTSLPHEILHNWWGNSVYVAEDSGNWAEGLTTYMADYWQAEKSGAARDYRMNVLMNYADFVTSSPDKDLALKDFKGRHNSSSQAVGYGKALMLFAMLENKFGRGTVEQALKDFYSAHQFQTAGYQDIQNSFEKITRQNLSTFFSQWTERKGAPEISLNEARVMGWTDGRFNVAFEIRQLQTLVYDLEIPVVITLENSQEIRFKIKSSSSRQPTVMMTSARPLKIAVDPDFQVFRKIYEDERPATLSTVFGSPAVHFYSAKNDKAAMEFIEAWSKKIDGHTSSHFVDDNSPLAQDGALVFIGDHSAFKDFVRNELRDQKFALTETDLIINEQRYSLRDSDSVLTMRIKGRKGQTLVWARWAPATKVSEWASRLTHYGSSGILVFQGRPVVLKSTWPVNSSPLQSEF